MSLPPTPTAIPFRCLSFPNPRPPVNVNEGRLESLAEEQKERLRGQFINFWQGPPLGRGEKALKLRLRLMLLMSCWPISYVEEKQLVKGPGRGQAQDHGRAGLDLAGNECITMRQEDLRLDLDLDLVLQHSTLRIQKHYRGLFEIHRGLSQPGLT
ncbi:GL14520 [Drosophila persimilis]|uniref:GL14520 n=1 Tax=Drosophila persimilis TaxID=7234 RepID=B4GQ89_DROPE|nr:GL14520 [Drosophila persimilis]